MLNINQNYTNDIISVIELANDLAKNHGPFKISADTVGDAGEYKLIPVGELSVDKKYQRWILTGVLKNIKNLDLTLLQPLAVWIRPDGTFVIGDGQHKSIMAIFSQGKDFEVPCMVYTHPKDRSEKRCLEIESTRFSQWNLLRKQAKKLDTIRSGLNYGDPDAIKFEKQFMSMGIQCEGIGDTVFGITVRGYTKADAAYQKYDLIPCKKAVDFLRPIYEQKGKDYVDGSMIFGLAAVFNLIGAMGGKKKSSGLMLYLETRFPKSKLNRWNQNTAGNLDYVIIARRIIEAYNYEVEGQTIEGTPIGETILEKNDLQRLEDR